MVHNAVPLLTSLIPLLVIAAGVLLVVLLLRHGGYYSDSGGNVIVRCHSGHLFTTIWIPGISLKAVRLGLTRFQFCPIGRHWTFVTPVKEADLTDEEKQFAAEHRDTRIP